MAKHAPLIGLLVGAAAWAISTQLSYSLVSRNCDLVAVVVPLIAAICLAMAAPMVLPGSGLLSSATGPAGPWGDVSLPPIVQLSSQLHSNDPRPLLTVRADSPSYLRLTALDVFDGTTFRPTGTDFSALRLATSMMVMSLVRPLATNSLA